MIRTDVTEWWWQYEARLSTEIDSNHRATILLLQSYNTTTTELQYCCYRATILLLQSYNTTTTELQYYNYRATILVPQSYNTTATASAM